MIEARAELRNHNLEVAFALFERNREGIITHAAAPAVFQPIEEFTGLKDCFYLSHAGSGAQILMDDLWRAGIRPTSVGTAGHLAAVEAHLASVKAEAVEMRQLVSQTVRALLPKP